MATSLINKSTGVVATPDANVTPEQTAAATAAGFIAEPTAGSVYKPFVAPTPSVGSAPQKTYLGQDGNTYDSATGAIVAHGDINPVNESSVRSSVLNGFQAEIDAQNQIYAQKLADAKTAGLGRLGSTRAVQSRSGLLGSDFAGAQNDTVDTANKGIETSINAEKAAAIASITNQANADATAQIAAKRQAQQAGVDEYLKFLSGQSTQKQTNLTKLAGSLLNQKLAPSDLNPQELQKLADQYGVSTGDILAEYNTQKKTSDAAQAKLDADTKATSFDQDLKTKQLALDTAYKNGQLTIDQYNAQTSRLNAMSAQFKAGLDANGNPIAGQASGVKTDALKSAQDLLAKFNAGSGTSAVGASGIFQLQNIPGTAASDFKVQFNNLKSLLSLDNVKLLKGQGAISDSERALLASASSKLDLAQSEPEFKAALNDIITSLSGATAGTGAAGAAIPKGTDGTSYGFPGYVSDGSQWIPK